MSQFHGQFYLADIFFLFNLDLTRTYQDQDFLFGYRCFQILNTNTGLNHYIDHYPKRNSVGLPTRPEGIPAFAHWPKLEKKNRSGRLFTAG